MSVRMRAGDLISEIETICTTLSSSQWRNAFRHICLFFVVSMSIDYNIYTAAIVLAHANSSHIITIDESIESET